MPCTAGFYNVLPDFSMASKPRCTEDDEAHYAQPSRQCTDKTIGLIEFSYKTAMDRGRIRPTYASHHNLFPPLRPSSSSAFSAWIGDLVADPFDFLLASRMYNDIAEQLSSISHVSQANRMGKYGRDFIASQSRRQFYRSCNISHGGGRMVIPVIISCEMYL